MEKGRPPQKSSRLLRSWPGSKEEYLCVCVCAQVCVCVCGGECVSSPEPNIPCVCMHVFIKKKKNEKKKPSEQYMFYLL